MNFIFIVDTSSSMLQTFDESFSFIDSAKISIEKFVKRREENAFMKDKDKEDRFLLINTSEDNNVISKWDDSLDHFLFQLKALSVKYDFSNIENSIQIALSLLNSTRKIPQDHHIYGRLVSKIQNTFIIIFTDGSKLNSSTRVFSKNTRINLTSQANDIFNEPFRWDYQLVNFVLNPYADSEDGLNILTKYSNIIGGQTYGCENFKDLISKVENFVNSVNTHRVNINIEINNNIINNIQKGEKNIELPLNNKLPCPEIKFVNQSAMFNNKYLIPLLVDFRRFKQLYPNNNNNKESVIYQENWPMPDEILINKNTKLLPKKRAHPTYIIGNEVKFNFDITKTLEIDHYDISDKDFLLKFLENYPDLTVTHLKFKPYWELYVTILSNEVAKKPFGIMKFFHKTKEGDTSIENDSNKNTQLSVFVKNNPNISFGFRVFILPYNFKELVGIIQKFESNLLNKSELVVNVEKYFSKIPFYYKPSLVQFLEKRNFGWKFDEKFLKAFENEHLNENIIKSIRVIKTDDINMMHEINKNLAISKQLHLKRQVICCGLNFFKNRSKPVDERKIEIVDEKEKSRLFNEYIDSLEKLKCDINISLTERNIKKVENDLNEVEIDYMGDYRFAMNQKIELRNPRIFDEEIPIPKSNIFGNPFSWTKKSKNAPVSDVDSIAGDLLTEKLEMKSEFEMFTKDLTPKKEDFYKFNGEYSKDLSRKRKREENNKKVYDINKCDFIEYIDKIEEETQIHSPSKSSVTSIKDEKVFSDNNKNIDEENKAISSFQNLFTKSLKIEVSGIKIKQVIDLDVNSILDWKFQENIKACIDMLK